MRGTGTEVGKINRTGARGMGTCKLTWTGARGEAARSDEEKLRAANPREKDKVARTRVVPRVRIGAAQDRVEQHNHSVTLRGSLPPTPPHQRTKRPQDF